MDKKERMELLVRKLLKVAVYDRRSGNFVCKVPVGNRSIGDEMGFIDRGIKKIQIDGTKERVHRIVYFLETGKIPHGIRHINGNRLDNRFENLRKISTREAVQKREKMRSDNTSGVCRLFYRKSKAGWYCGVRINGKYKERRIKNFENAENECIEFLSKFNNAIYHLTKETDKKFKEKQKRVVAEALAEDYVMCMEKYEKILEREKERQSENGAELWEFKVGEEIRKIATCMSAGELVVLKELI